MVWEYSQLIRPLRHFEVFNTYDWWVQIFPKYGGITASKAIVRKIWLTDLMQYLKIIIFAFIACSLFNLQNQFMRFISIFSLITNFMGVSTEGQSPTQSYSNGVPVSQCITYHLSFHHTTPQQFHDYRQ